MSEQVTQGPSWLQRHRTQIAIAAASLVAALAPELAPNDTSTDVYQGLGQTVPAHVEPTIKREPTSGQVINQSETDWIWNGYSASVTPPETGDNDFYLSEYLVQEGSLPISDAPPPRLREVIDVLDDRGLPDKVNDNSGFTIYNATNEPVNVPFVHYELDFLESWVRAHKAGVSISDIMTAKVRSNDSQWHSIFLVPAMPPGHDKKDDRTAFTSKPPGSTYTWADFGKQHIPGEEQEDIFGRTNHQYSRYIHLGVELCQSLVDVSDPTILIGAGQAEEAVQRYMTQGDADYHNPTMAAQEIVCNSLGRILVASWFHGLNGLGHMDALDNGQMGLQGTQVFDFNLADSQIENMLALRSRIANNPGRLHVLAGSKTPTAEYYERIH